MRVNEWRTDREIADDIDVSAPIRLYSPLSRDRPVQTV